jgi:uncharacterized Fe-S radical SAM superfamily protein PflX
MELEKEKDILEDTLLYLFEVGYDDLREYVRLIKEYDLSIEEITEIIREQLKMAGHADPVYAVYRYVESELPYDAEVELMGCYGATYMEVKIPKEEFEKLPPNIQRFLKEEAEIEFVQPEQKSKRKKTLGL